MRSVTIGSHKASPIPHINESQRASRPAQKQRKACLKVRAADALCKDLVNEPKRLQQSTEGSSTVTFLGAGGKEMSVECPKVSPKCHLRGAAPGNCQAHASSKFWDTGKIGLFPRLPVTRTLYQFRALRRCRTPTFWTLVWRPEWSCLTRAEAASAGISSLLNQHRFRVR